MRGRAVRSGVSRETPPRVRAGPVDEQSWVRPAPPLRPYVSDYAGYRQAGLPPGRHRGLPSPRLTLIFTLDEPLTLAGHPDPGQAPATYDTLIGGLHTRPALIDHQGRQSGIQIGLHPLGARALLGLPAGELASLDLPAEAVLGRFGADLGERLRTAPGWPERFALLDAALLHRLSRPSRRGRRRGTLKSAAHRGPPTDPGGPAICPRTSPRPPPPRRYGRRCGRAMPVG
ncbi:DUF6597 domain-containing transcriptional factor [Streptomyces platensis]|uniref:DUF6597 domain-containing transcriptional factor n=1 Tax=Streptomyces platensis TaxID=58346 RepID=UPI0027E55761|nr:DUF6597 domain-containing transcriptional factor [Streptomyces platensis]